MTNIKSISKRILFVILTIQIIFAIINTSHASESKPWEVFTWDNIMQKGEDFISEGKDTADSGEFTKESSGDEGTKTVIKIPTGEDIKPIINKIYNIIFVLGVAITVIIGGVLGIKFMTSSVEGKAKIKESIIPYMAGCVAIYGALGIWKLAINIFSGI